MVEDEARPRGILTQADRKFLWGEKDLKDQSARNTRRRIRNRVYQSLLDFSVLWQFLDDDDLQLIFEAHNDRRKSEVRTAAQDAIALIILGLWENNDFYPDRITHAIEQAAYAQNKSAKVDFDIEEEFMDSPDEILMKLLDSGLERIPYAEFEKALTHPDADPELLHKVFGEMDPDYDLSIEDVREMQQAKAEYPVVRYSLPYVIEKKPILGSDKSEIEDN